MLFRELFLISGICSRLNISKVPDLSHVEHVGVSTDRLTIARIMADELTVASTSTAFCQSTSTVVLCGFNNIVQMISVEFTYSSHCTVYCKVPN